jgi:hypothetical protein
MFKEYLMTMGLRWSEEEADKFLKDFNPKTDPTFNFMDVVKKIMKDKLK